MDASIGTFALVIGDNPTGLPFLKVGFADALYDASQNLPVLALIGAIAALFFRLRSARGVERQQIKWFGYATVLVGIATIGTIYSVWLPLLGFDPAQPPDWAPLLNTFWNLAVLALPLSICVAVLRYRLYDIDLMIRRTLVYGGLTALLALLYLDQRRHPPAGTPPADPGVGPGDRRFHAGRRCALTAAAADDATRAPVVVAPAADSPTILTSCRKFGPRSLSSSRAFSSGDSRKCCALARHEGTHRRTGLSRRAPAEYGG